MYAAVLNSTQPPRRYRDTAGPYGSFVILDNLEDVSSGEFCVLSKIAVLPPGQTFRCTNPKTPVACSGQAHDDVGGELLARRRLPWDVAPAIEAQQTGLRSQPKVTVWRLRYCLD